MARGGDRNPADDAAGEFDSAFRDAVLRPWRGASPRPTPAGVTEPAATDTGQSGAEIDDLRQQLAAARDELAAERDARAVERRELQARIDDLTARPDPSLAELARGIDDLTARMRSLAARPDPRP